MGQKVHPLGFRVGITKKHQSQWFSRFNKHKYAQSVLEDHMLRQTLKNLFPQLLNPVLKKQIRDKNEETSIVPRITQIKIERGLIPYEIGIQIHAENCDLIKKSIENLKVNRDLLCHLQKTRSYLQHLQSKLNDFNNHDFNTVKALVLPLGNKEIFEKKKLKTKIEKRKSQKGRFKARLTRQQVRRQRLILKRYKKRQVIRRRYKQLVYNRLFLTKKGNKVIQKYKTVESSFKQKNSKLSFKKFELRKEGKKLQVTKNSSVNYFSKTTNIFKSRVKKKFVSVFINRMNKKFLQTLKNCFISSLSSQTDTTTIKPTVLSTSLGWSKKWDFNYIKKQLTLKPLTQLNKLSAVLEQKSLKKMESLRKDFIVSGLISKADALNYYQMLYFLKQLRELISQIKRKQKLQILLTKFYNEKNSMLSNKKTSASGYSPILLKNKSVNTLMHERSSYMNFFHALVYKLQNRGDVTDVTFNVLAKKLNNIENECRKIQFIEFLKQVVRKHRTEKIFLYLSTIADARKDLRKLQQFTKRNISFFFGKSFTNTKETQDSSIVTFERVSNIYKQSSLSLAIIPQKNEIQSTLSNTKHLPNLSNIFLEQIEKQRKMYKDTVQLTPKIAIKFYSVNSNSLKAKASVVADSVVDALEKRKAFRKVIKDAKEDLIRTSGVKGVKIQVSGRLNGAEIARSEWVRAGRVPLQTLRAKLDFSYKIANTIYGIIGVKVWIFKGYTKLLRF